MGIVVTIFMGLGLLLLLPAGADWLERRAPGRGIEKAIVYGLLLAGLWNGLWHGLRHLDDFWGLAALLSGACMVAAALLLRGARGATRPTGDVHWWRRTATGVASAGLFASFLLYAVTLIRLNLGLPIIGP